MVPLSYLLYPTWTRVWLAEQNRPTLLTGRFAFVWSDIACLESFAYVRHCARARLLRSRDSVNTTSYNPTLFTLLISSCEQETKENNYTFLCNTYRTDPFATVITLLGKNRVVLYIIYLRTNSALISHLFFAMYGLFKGPVVSRLPDKSRRDFYE